jgi:GGDEF domain-containing protein
MAVLTPETFDFVLTNELKRALRSQNFVTLVLLEPRGGEPGPALREIAGLIQPELRETDLVGVDDTSLSLVLLDADLQHAGGVIDRVMARLEHYQFSTPLDIHVGAACCPTHGADADTLKRVAADARSEVTRRPPRDSAQA